MGTCSLVIMSPESTNSLRLLLLLASACQLWLCECMNQESKDLLIGAPGGDLPPNQTIADLLHQIKSLFEARIGEEFECLEPVSFRLQIVAGSIYFIKVRSISVERSKPDRPKKAERYHHLKVYQIKGKKPVLKGVRLDVKADEALDYF